MSFQVKHTPPLPILVCQAATGFTVEPFSIKNPEAISIRLLESETLDQSWRIAGSTRSVGCSYPVRSIPHHFLPRFFDLDTPHIVCSQIVNDHFGNLNQKPTFF